MTTAFTHLTTTSGSDQPVPLTSLPSGTHARVACRDMDGDNSELLCAMGLKNDCPLEVCRSGRMCIVKVDNTRLALSRKVARRIMVHPSEAASA
ncbi:MAG: FeoA family protein [Planctomycetota bacterium]